ncbi:MAG: hypothetical protein UW30_C0015G0029 [Candidatus Giovannonibacteria bacterium GW2011_GWA2_44_13b]|uniref:Uncharacterized protein n=2 Tax=Candidatus Giovannoniibacteriota TaxID=1752738 RepID=A0A0G1H348_9BACT|nr:MAG: hypothetical protein UW30_C0015G0029 [Candidatus Giovannonibacteria bacterium GW2011_GWA2_44_13b]OGF82466.1 MAG: hypothetical protein A2924_01260 [Candidatus Giovannonibacteria bacterium RIFCSPLOWO2_01_FULL_44_16]
MRKFVKILGILAVIFSLASLYNFFALGQRDLGFSNVYYYCENGISQIYPAGMIDGIDSNYKTQVYTYYDKNGISIGACRPDEAQECMRVKELAGTCEKRGIPLYNLIIPRYLWDLWIALNSTPSAPH